VLQHQRGDDGVEPTGFEGPRLRGVEFLERHRTRIEALPRTDEHLVGHVRRHDVPRLRSNPLSVEPGAAPEFEHSFIFLDKCLFSQNFRVQVAGVVGIGVVLRRPPVVGILRIRGHRTLAHQETTLERVPNAGELRTCPPRFT